MGKNLIRTKLVLLQTLVRRCIKLADEPFCFGDFSYEHLQHSANTDPLDACFIGDRCWISSDVMYILIKVLNYYRERYIATKNKDYWWQMIQLLPSSYNQRRTVMLNYEVLANIYKSRKNHKLDEWRIFCDWIKELPYSEIITGKSEMSGKEEENEQNK